MPRLVRSLGLLLAVLALTTLTACDKLLHRPQTTFSGDSALTYVAAQLAFGPRVPGTTGATKTGDWIIAQMRRRADTVIVQSWNHVTAKGQTLPLRNIFARINPSATSRVLYVTHWDTRPIANQDRNLGNRSLPIPGANDGASGVALLIGVADALRKTPPTYGVDLLFVDGEDWGDFDTYRDTATAPDVLIGSTYFANHLPTPDYKPIFGVLFDMIGDRDLQIYPEQFSIDAAPEVVTRVWDTAKELGYDKWFIAESKGGITDDHIPLIRKGLRVVDVIDIDYCSTGVNCFTDLDRNYHHTMQDTIDKVSARSLQIVGDVAVALVTR